MKTGNVKHRSDYKVLCILLLENRTHCDFFQNGFTNQMEAMKDTDTLGSSLAPCNGQDRTMDSVQITISVN